MLCSLADARADTWPSSVLIALHSPVGGSLPLCTASSPASVPLSPDSKCSLAGAAPPVTAVSLAVVIARTAQVQAQLMPLPVLMMMRGVQCRRSSGSRPPRRTETAAQPCLPLPVHHIAPAPPPPSPSAPHPPHQSTLQLPLPAPCPRPRHPQTRPCSRRATSRMTLWSHLTWTQQDHQILPSLPRYRA